MRGGNSIFTTVLEIERKRERMGKQVDPSNSAQDRQTDRQTSSPEHLQCAQDLPSVCINKHHPATTRLVRLMCLSEKPAQPRSTPLRSLPTGTETAAQTDQAECFPRGKKGRGARERERE